jgi:hypothetical protein
MNRKLEPCWLKLQKWFTHIAKSHKYAATGTPVIVPCVVHGPRFAKRSFVFQVSV